MGIYEGSLIQLNLRELLGFLGRGMPFKKKKNLCYAPVVSMQYLTENENLFDKKCKKEKKNIGSSSQQLISLNNYVIFCKHQGPV